MALTAALIGAQLWLGEITRPRPKKFTFQDLLDSVNKGDETRPIPYIRGKWKTKPQRIWLGDFKARAVERDSKWTDYLWAGPSAFLLDAITVSYRYYAGQGFALCWGPINRVHQVYVDDLPCAVSPVVDNAGGSLLLDDPNLFGGDQPPGLGGVYAVCDVIAGNYTQGRNAYIQSLEGNIPALHGVAGLVVRGPSGATESGFFSALQLNLREWAVEVMAWPDVLGDGLNHLTDDSYNRVHALYEWATSADYGAEYPTARIHRPSWLQASQTTYDEGLGFRGEINTGENVRQIFDAIKESIDAEVYEHPADGLKIKLVRKDYSLPLIPVLDESNCDVVEEYTPGDLADTFNRVELDFIDSSNNYQPKKAVYEDPANRTLRRFGSIKTIQYPGVGSAGLGQLLVTREGRAAAQPLPPLVTNAGEVARDLWPGDTYQFEWTDPLVRKVFRVHARTPSVAFEAPRNFRIQSTEDQYSIGMSVFGAPEGTDASDPVDCWDTAPPDAEFNDTDFPPDGLEYTLLPGIGGGLQSWIRGGIVFGEYACGQYARVYVTEPGGVETLSPIRVMPDADGLGEFNWPALTSGTYTFCIQTFSLTGQTTGTKVCASIGAASFSQSPSASVSPSHSASPSASPSTSPSSSPSPSVSPSGSPSPSGSASASTSPSHSASPSVSPSLSQSPSGSQSPSASSSPSASTSPSHSTSPSSSASPSSGAGSEVPFTTGLVLALEADHTVGLSNNDPVDEWPDYSASNNDATSSGTNRPTYKTNQLNGLPGLDFSGTNSMNLTASIDCDPVTIFAVLSRDTGNGPYTVIAGGTNCGQYRIFNGKANFLKASVADMGSETNTLTVDQFYVLGFTYSNPNLAFYKDGAADGTASSAQTLSDFNKVGEKGTEGEKYAGVICALLVYNSVLSSTDRGTVTSYLGSKYGISV